MIVLFSYDGDANTNYLIDWLKFYKCRFLRIDLSKEDSKNIEIQLSDDLVSIQLKLSTGETIDLSSCSYFYTRGNGFNLQNAVKPEHIPNVVFEKYLNMEFNAFTHFFYREVNKKSIGCFRNENHTKLLQLKYAQSVGLSVGKSIIVNNKSKLLEAVSNEKIITKAIQENIAIDFEDRLMVQRVQRINKDLLPDEFYSSFFQSEIDKEYEIRTFYLDEKCYSICFHSDTSNIDMRDNYSIAHYEPYNLPDVIESKIIQFMKKLELISGSIDMIKSKNGDYVFLEVNPNGQYDWVSQYGGYNLHQKIAKFLISKVKEHEK